MQENTVLLGQFDAFQCLCDCADLVDLDEDGIASLHIDALAETLGVGHEEVISNTLDLASQLLGKLHIAIPVVLGGQSELVRKSYNAAL